MEVTHNWITLQYTVINSVSHWLIWRNAKESTILRNTIEMVLNLLPFSQIPGMKNKAFFVLDSPILCLFLDHPRV